MISPAALLRARGAGRDGVPSARALEAAARALPGRDRRTLPSSWRSRWPAFVLSCAARAVLITVLWLVGWSLLPAAAGWESTVVVSGSMAPRLQVGDVVVARPVASDQLRTGMVLLVDDPDHPGRLRVHRLVGIENGMLRLRGDANPQDDSALVAPSAVHGTGALRLPAIGRPVVWWSERDLPALLTAGTALTLLVGAATLHRHPGGSLAPVRAGRRAHRAPRSGGALLGSLPERRTATRHRHRPPRARSRAVVALTGLLTAVLTVVTTSTADAKYTTTTTQGPDTWVANDHYTCAEAAASPAAQLYYPLQETAGTVAANAGTAGTANNGTYEGAIVLGQPGPNCRGADDAVRLDGSTTYITSPFPVTNPNTFSLEIWLRTGTPGGLVLGFRRDGGSGNDNDRMIYMSNGGRLFFGQEPVTGAYRTVNSTTGYADNAWHHVVATQGSGGAALYVDGVLVDSDSAMTTGFNASGTWRMGRGQTAGWPSEPTNRYYTGLLAHAAVYTTALSLDDVKGHYHAGR
ncbi:LamG-like jellyroll fold domain-containing protein [Modestobacter sp. SSW1-42]|uniref:LamG-like jellyroll fold domain-containing protein n=1 Tax=Modestobacter sp. SSW1-42 TaxID=596372 RepID=UPI0039878600